MKKLSLSIAAVAAGTALLVVNAVGAGSAAPADNRDVPSAMGFLIVDDSRPTGWYTFPLTDASSPALIGKSAMVSAGTMTGDGTYYALTYSSGPTPAAWNTVNVSDGTVSQLAPAADGQPLYVDMTYDYSADRLLAIYHYGGKSTTLCEVDRATGKPAATVLDVEDNWLAGIAASYEGDLYAISNDGCLYCLDRGATEFTALGSPVRGDVEYMQSMAFDHASGELYWACATATDAYLYRLDTLTGEGTLISKIGDNGELTGLYIPGDPAVQGAPAAVAGLTVSNPAHDGNVTVSATLPAVKADGTALDALASAVLDIDGKEARTITGSQIVPGAAISIDVEVAEGMHRFCLRAVNGEGKGLPASVKTFVGEDIPATPSSLVVTTASDHADISWEPVTSGAHGGYVNLSALTYTVTRQPGNVTVAEGLTATSCTDHVDGMGTYVYHVAAVTPRGAGAAITSETVVIGESVTLPYSYDFEDAMGLSLWTVTDGNNDGMTWARSMTLDGARTMIMRGNNSYAADDWLISPPLMLERGKEYKLVYDDGCMNSNYPASYSLTIGRAPAAADQSTVLRTVTTDRRMLNRQYVTIPAVEETGIYYIGFHAYWKPSLASLYISNFTIGENEYATLSGTVTDGRMPIAGATVELGFGSTVMTTDADGHFSVAQVAPGEYGLTVTAHGYEPVTRNLTFNTLEQKIVTVEMTAIRTAAIGGRAVDTDGHPIANASVSVHGYHNYAVQTDRDGYFMVRNVYCTGAYSVDVYAVNYEPVALRVDDMTGDVDMGTVTLPVKLLSPGDVTVEADRSSSVVSWSAPEDKPVTLRYDDGTDLYVFNMEMSAVTEHTAAGVIFDTPALITSVSWNVWNSSTDGLPVDVLIFDLDENGIPTTTILYERNGISSRNGRWIEHQLDYPVVAPRGALVALRGDARLCMDLGGEDPAYPAMLDKMVFTHDYRTEPFHSRYDDNTYMFRGNLTLRASGLLYGAPRVKNAAAQSVPAATYNVWRLSDGDQNNEQAWTALTDTPVDVTEYTDATWASLPKGIYRYAVKARYNDGGESLAAISDAVMCRLVSTVTLTFGTDVPGESAADAKIVLSGKDNSYSYTGTVGEDGNVEFAGVHEGVYALTCTKQGFLTIEDEIEVTGDADICRSYTLAETVEAPSNLIVEETGLESSRLLRWNVITGIFDDFESHDDWTVNSPGEVGWTYIDGDGQATYTSPNYTFPNAYAPMAFIVMNPSQAVPDMVQSEYLDAYSGDKAIVAWGTSNGDPNNDYIISPRLDMTDDFVISFYTRCYWSHYVETLRVGYSVSGNAADDFVWIGNNIKVEHDTWRQYVVNVPAEARYVAINCVSVNNYYVAIDDIFIGAAKDIPDTSARRAAGIGLLDAGKAIGYEVYLDNVRIGETDASEYLLENLSAGSHVAGVKAVYGSGVTDMATVAFDVTLSGVDEVIGNAVAVMTDGGCIIVRGAPCGETVDVYAADGVQVSSVVADGGDVRIPLRPGVYIVRCGTHAVKVALR